MIKYIMLLIYLKIFKNTNYRQNFTPENGRKMKTGNPFFLKLCVFSD